MTIKRLTEKTVFYLHHIDMVKSSLPKGGVVTPLYRGIDSPYAYGEMTISNNIRFSETEILVGG
jgi:hypothetical protein